MTYEKLRAHCDEMALAINNMTSDTPRTNASTGWGIGGLEVTPASFSRTLERELIEMRAGYLDLLGQVEQARGGFGIYRASPSMVGQDRIL